MLRRWRSCCAEIKRLLFNRPLGLKQVGKGAAILSPCAISGGRYIEIGDKSRIMQGCRIEAISLYADQSFNPSISVGSNVYIGRSLFITAIQQVHIGDGCVLSDQVYLADSSHGFDPTKGEIMRQRLNSKGPVYIGSNCFLGYRVVVTAGVTLGDWCVVGANSVVTKSFPAYSMVAGAPARLIKRYLPELGKWVSV